MKQTVTKTFVRRLWQEHKRTGDQAVAEVLLKTLRAMQDGNYTGAIQAALEHGFDLATMQRAGRSGALKSSWGRILEEAKRHGIRLQWNVGKE